MAEVNQPHSSRRGPKGLLRLIIFAVIGVAIVVALLTLSVVGPNASAAKDLRAALATTRDYRGWVHVRVAPPQTRLSLPDGVVAPTTSTTQPTGSSGHVNTLDGRWARDRKVNGHRQIELHEPAKQVTSVYNVSTNELRISPQSVSVPPGFADGIAGAPVSVTDLLERYDTANNAPPSTDATRDGELTRYDLVGRGERRAFKGSIWINPADKLVRKARWDTPDGAVDVTYTYGPPEISAIAALGVPDNAKVVQAGATP
jgi:hypothetical protein